MRLSRSLVRLALACSGTVWLALPVSAAMSQVARTAPALQLTAVTPDEHGHRYQYRVVGSSNPREILADVYLDIGTPWQAEPPIVLRTDGAFLFDALQVKHHEVAVGHAPLAISTPPQWSAAIYRQGVLSWGASRWARGANHGVRTKQQRDGFALWSPALPALRRFRVVPWRPFASAGSLEDESGGAPHDSTWVLYAGHVLAPGWMPEHVTGDYLVEQITIACEAHLLDACGRYLRLTDAVRAAERARNDRSYAVAIGTLQATIGRDRVSHQNARYVLHLAATALARRAPSRRPERNPPGTPRR